MLGRYCTALSASDSAESDPSAAGRHQSATKAHAADDILKGCHYDLPLLLHVTTAEPLAGNSQK
jgi:hypothetical protein